MDGLELRVDERRLHHRREHGVVHADAQIVQQCGHPLRRRRHEVGAARGVVVAADPVLHLADRSGKPRRGRRVHQTGVHIADLGESEGRRARRTIDRQLHRIDVPNDLQRRAPDPSSPVGLGLGAGELAGTDLEPFDLRRGDRLRAEQESRERGQGGVCVGVQRGDRGFCIGHGARRFGVERDREFSERGRDERSIPARSPIARWGIRCRVVLPACVDVGARHAELQFRSLFSLHIILNLCKMLSSVCLLN